MRRNTHSFQFPTIGVGRSEQRVTTCRFWLILVANLTSFDDSPKWIITQGLRSDYSRARINRVCIAAHRGVINVDDAIQNAYAAEKWIRSTHCTLGKNCVELSRGASAVAVRDSKNGASHLRFGTASWASFLDRCRAEF